MRYMLMCFAALVVIPLGAMASDVNLGISRLHYKVAGVDVTARVFYPTSETAKTTSFGPWSMNAALNARPTPSAKPLIVMSHGLGGNDWNQHLLANRLVQNGFVVLAVRHPDDFMRVGRPAILSLRPLEIKMGLDTILADPTFGPVVDDSKIGAFGYSQGGIVGHDHPWCKS